MVLAPADRVRDRRLAELVRGVRRQLAAPRGPAVLVEVLAVRARDRDTVVLVERGRVRPRNGGGTDARAVGELRVDIFSIVLFN